MRELGAMTWGEVGDAIVVVPIGSCEQHGPHLPLHTDALVAAGIADALVERRRDCYVAPPIAITASGEHQGFPGTLSIGTEAMATVVVELVRSADWARGVVLVNGHGGNAPAVERATTTLRGEGRRVLAWWPVVPDGDLHAGRTETSLALAIAPDQVRLDRATTGPVPSLTDLVRHGVRALSPTGVLGDPTGAGAAEGRRLLAHLVDDLDRAIDRVASEWAPRRAAG